MKTTITRLLLVKMYIVLVTASVVFATEPEVGTKKIILPPGASTWFKVGPFVNKKLIINTLRNQGDVHVEVFNDHGQIVAAGINKVSFLTGNKQSKYKIVITNTTNQFQTVIVSYTATDDLWT